MKEIQTDATFAAMKLGFVFGCLLLVAGWTNVIAQDPIPEKYDPMIESWQAVPVPSKSDKAALQRFFDRANWSKANWEVKIKNGRMHASLKEPGARKDALPPTVKFKLPDDDKYWAALSFHQVEDGWLGASNRGEFGSDVLWMSSDGKRIQHLSHDRIWVWEFISLDGRHFAIDGIEHGGLCKGSVIELVKDKSKWTVQTLVKLPRAALAATVLSDKTFCVATSSNLLTISVDKKIEVLAEDAWDGLAPNSIEIDSNGAFAYIGMSQFVVRVDLWKTGQSPITYLVPNLDFLNKTGNRFE